MMLEKIIFSGFGGQGILFMGKLLAQVAMSEGLEVSYMPSYGAEVRGGTAHSMVVVSDSAVPSPVVKQPTSCIAMNRPSLEKFEHKIMPDGLLIVNTSLASGKVTRDNIRVVEVPATETATEMGDIRVANMIIFGAYIGITQIVSFESVMENLKRFLAGKKSTLLPLNERALKKGIALSNKQLV